MKILIAENSPTGRNQLTRMLELDGHDVLQAATWEETQVLFSAHRPDLVLLEPSLPDADGHSCVPELKRLSPSRFLPVILVTSISDHITLSRFLESQADDFIDPPYDHLVLKAKIAGFERVDDLYCRLEKFRSATEQEIKLAKHMFDTIIQRKPRNTDFIQHWSLAAGHFSGDLLIFERTPDNTLHIMLGDFTGHGLVAAVGALPTSDIFFAMTQKGFGIGEIAAEINRKLRRLLPMGQFCSASLLSICPRTNRMEVWNGGLPPILLVNAQRDIVRSLSSDKLPLGILDESAFDAATVAIAADGVCHIVLYSDGLVEAQNSEGLQFGDRGMAGALAGACANCPLIQSIKAKVIDFLNGLEPHDDISLLTVNLESLS